MSPIKTMDVRFPRVGFFSVGHQIAAPKKGGKKGEVVVRPTTSDTLIVHMRSREPLEVFAERYGGTPAESPTSTEEIERWFLKTEATEIPVVLPGELELSFSQNYEAYTSGGLKRLCDGVTTQRWRMDPDTSKKEVVGAMSSDPRPCMCEAELAEGAEERMCKPTVRLDVLPVEVIAELDEIGVFTVRSTGWFTNSALLGDTQLIHAMIGAIGPAVPLRLRVEQVKTRRGMRPRFRVTTAASLRTISERLEAGPRPIALPAPTERAPEDDEPVGTFVDKPKEPEAAGRKDQGGPGEHGAASESRTDTAPAAPGSGEFLVIGGVSVPFVGFAKASRTVPALTPAQIPVLERAAVEVGWTLDDIPAGYAAFAGHDYPNQASREGVQAFTEFLRETAKTKASA